jgi:hypothetical protein
MRPAGEVGQAAWKGPLRHSVWSCCWPRRPEYVACFAFQMNREPMQDYVVRVVHKKCAPERTPSLYSSARFSRRAAPVVFPYRTPFSCHFSPKIFCHERSAPPRMPSMLRLEMYEPTIPATKEQVERTLKSLTERIYSGTKGSQKILEPLRV